MPSQILTHNNTDATSRRHTIGKLVLAGISAEVFLLLSYYAFGGQPPWLIHLKLLEKAPPQDRKLFFFALEFFAMAIATWGAIHARGKGKGRVSSISLRWRGLTFLAVIASTVGYGWYRIKVYDENLGCRATYAAFTTLFVLVWLYSIAAGQIRFFMPIRRLLRVLSYSPTSVFSVGPTLERKVMAAVISIFPPLIALLLWLPTLLPGVTNPFVLGVLTAVIVSGTALAQPLIVQRRISVAVSWCLSKVDDYVAQQLLSVSRRTSCNTKSSNSNEKDSDPIERLKAMMEVRQQILSSIRMPAKALVVPLIQAATTIGALLATFKDK